jgi:LacI family transcriptional regulator
MGKNGGVTINDVAQRTGVSKVTVSYVLNERHTGIKISDGTRQRVLAAARELGYHPNALARGLARRRTDTLTLVMHSPRFFADGSSFAIALMRGVLDKANESGFDVMFHTKRLPDIEQEVRAVTDGRADGALVLRALDDPLTEQLAARAFPFVQIFSRTPVPGAWFVDCDNVAGGRLATEYLLDLGHRRVGHVGGSPSSAPALDRYEGYKQALAGRDCAAADPAWYCQIPYPGGDFSAVAEMMRGPDAPTALFVWSDDVALGVIRLLREQLGLRVPEDVSVLGFDGTELGEHTAPRLSSMGQPIVEMAARGVEMLIARIDKRPVPETQVFFAPALIARDSCASPPTP